MSPSKNWKTISLKKSLLNELNKIAEAKDITPTTLINQILWTYADLWKLLVNAKEIDTLLKDIRGDA